MSQYAIAAIIYLYLKIAARRVSLNHIHRHITDPLINCRNTFSITFLIGPRQVGKSTTLTTVFSDLPYTTLDDPLLLNLIKLDTGLFIQGNPAPRIIDEVQNASELFPFLKMISDKEQKNGLFLLTGSQQFHLMKHVTKSIAGRVAILELQGLSLREIFGVKYARHFIPEKVYIEERMKSYVKYDRLWHHIHRGSYPALQNPSIDWEILFRSYVSTYIERDISDLLKVKDKVKFLNFLIAMAARTGQMLNYNNVSDEIGVSVETVRNWTSLLETTGIIYILEPYAPSALKRAIRTPKLYFRDTGLVCYLTKWMTPEVLSVGAQNGAIFETFVISELVKSFSNEGKGYRDHVFYYRGKDKVRRRPDGTLTNIETEIDFIIEENGILHPIEIKMSTSPDASMTSAFEVLDGVPDKKRGLGAIIFLYDKVVFLRDNLVVLPIELL